MKGIFDGVISAFQAHTDMAVLPEVTARLAAILQADRTEIEKHLLVENAPGADNLLALTAMQAMGEG